MNNEPDGMLGAVMASESLGLTDTLINGAGGCRSRAQIMMHDLIPSYVPENRCCARSKYFSRQSRLPCTYLGNDDIVFGTSAKVSEGVEAVSSITGRRAVLLDTLGASLLCTDYTGLTGSSETSPITIEGDLSSVSASEGYDLVTDAILSSLELDSGDDGTVNIFGYGLMDLGWEAGEEQIRSLLAPMGVKVGCVAGCIPSRESLMGCGRSSLNVMIHPEYCGRTVSSLRKRFGTPCLRPSAGAPIGYPALRSFVKEVGEALGLDPTPSLEYIDADARKVHGVLMNYDRAPLSLHGKGFRIDGDSSVVYPIAKWMCEAFGMAPRSVRTHDGEYSDEIAGYLASIGFQDALNGTGGEPDLVFSDGMAALQGRLERGIAGHVEIGIPRGRYMDLMGRTLVGTQGCRYILDEMFNSMVRFRCGQPTEVDYRPGCCRGRFPKRITVVRLACLMEGFGRIGQWFRAEVALVVSAALALASMLLVPPSEEYLGYIDAPMLCLLFCLMAAVAGMSECGLFRSVSAALVSKAGTARLLCLVLVGLPFLASMAITNDVALITFVPLAVAALVGAGRKDLVVPVLVMQTLAANLGSIVTPIGNPQNLFIFSRYGPGMADFVLEMLPLAVVGGAALFISCALVCKGRSRSRDVEVPEVTDRPVLAAMAALFAISVASVAGLLPFWAALVCTVAVTLLLKPAVLRRVDYSLLLTFVFLFVFTGNVARIDAVASFLGDLMESQPMLTPVLSSQAISNVPSAVMLSGFTDDWRSLLAGVNIGGFGTPIASMASLITFRLYAKGEVHDGRRFMAVFILANAAMLLLLIPVRVLIRIGICCGAPFRACTCLRWASGPPSGIPRR